MNITFDYPFNHSTKKFHYWSVTPALDFVVDKQNESWTGDNGEFHRGDVTYSLGFHWLKFAFYINLEILLK